LFQGRKSQTRLHLRIDDEPVCEVDYRYLHPALLHAMEGLELEYDPYEVEGYSRTVVKVAFQVLINTQKPFPAANSLMFFLNKAKRKKKNWNDPEWQGQSFTKDYCLKLSEAIAERNRPIAHHFSTGAGIKLQHTDSILVSAVLDFVRKQSPSTVVIPIHDSFVIKQSELDVLLDALGYAETILSKVKGSAVRTPTLKATAIKGTEIETYIQLLKKYKLEGEEESSIKEEDLTQELREFTTYDTDDTESYEFDAAIED
jgi:hypothetical protein